MESAALGASEGVPVSESSLADFRESESSDGQTTATSYESPQSERQALLERARASRTGNPAFARSADQAQPADAGFIDMEAVRQQALADAIEDGRRLHRQTAYCEPEQPPQPSPQAEMERLRAELAADFGRRMDAIKPPDMDQLMAAAGQEGTDVSPEVADTLMTLDGGPQAVIYLLKHADERQKLARLPSHIAVGYAGHLAAQLAAPARRQRSSAPAPISPVGGSSTRSSLAPDTMSYQDY